MATGRIGTTPVLTTRWSKAPSAGTTSLSGLDDNSVSLVYSVGYEAVYQNGVLLSRGNDYTATNGTTITLTTATVAGDIIEVFANQTIPLTDTYSQTVSDGRFIKNTLTTTTGDIIYASAANTPARLGIGSTNQVLTVSGGVPAWAAASGSAFVFISRQTASGSSAIDFTSVFSSTYQSYILVVEDMYGSSSQAALLCTVKTSSGEVTSGYYFNNSANNFNNVSVGTNGNNTSAWTLAQSALSTSSNSPVSGFYLVSPGNVNSAINMSGFGTSNQQGGNISFGGVVGAATYTGLKLKASTGTITGSATLYGLAKS